MLTALFALTIAYNSLIGCNVEVGIQGPKVISRSTCGFDVKAGANGGYLFIVGKDQVTVFKLPKTNGVLSWSWDWDHGYFNGREIPVHHTQTLI